MPKDIVSGDFYWMHDSGFKQYIAAVDCTGHGVPGAFMSIIGHNSLNKIVRESGISRPSDILDHLNIEVVHALLQRSEKAVRDGMDISSYPTTSLSTLLNMPVHTSPFIMSVTAR
jgi:serine phosphatase RsbU (regulator of sigma subunit)